MITGSTTGGGRERWGKQCARPRISRHGSSRRWERGTSRNCCLYRGSLQVEQKNSKMRKVLYLRLQFWSRQSRADAFVEHRPPQMLQQHGEFSFQHDLEPSNTLEFTSILNNTFTFTIQIHLIHQNSPQSQTSPPLCRWRTLDCQATLCDNRSSCKPSP